MKDTLGDKTLAQLENEFESNVLTALNRRVQMKLVTPCTMSCTLYSNFSREYPFIGDEVFNVIAARVDPNDISRMLLRFAPPERQEYRYIEVGKANATDRFKFRLVRADGATPWASYATLLEDAMSERDDKTTLTYREMVSAALAHEHAKVKKELLSSHAEFGSW
jgi:hypothetical protein